MSIELSVVVPMFNEEENVLPTVEAIHAALKDQVTNFEILLINDGSTDNTAREVKNAIAKFPIVRTVGYPRNRGRGRAIRTGFANARGKYVVAIEADLSYSPEHILKIYNTLITNPHVDIVLGSVHMPGGSIGNVSLFRKLLSRYGNRIVSLAFHGKYYTLTAVLRGYKREVFDWLDLDADRKEIHLEIIARAEDLGLNIMEIPAHLNSRRGGRSKTKIYNTSLEHIAFSIAERPSLFYGIGGLLLIFAGLGIGSYIISLFLKETLNPTRPLIPLLVICIVTGSIWLLFGLISRELRYHRKELHNQRAKLNYFAEEFKRFAKRIEESSTDTKN